MDQTMKNLPILLKREHYRKIKFKVTKTQHLLIKATLNEKKGNFILDTGASNSCVGSNSIEDFELKASHSKNKATGAGATGIHTQVAEQNTLQIGTWKTINFSIVIIDLSHVNDALLQQKAKPVHGIIGADVLLQGKGIIDYANQYLYLK